MHEINSQTRTLAQVASYATDRISSDCLNADSYVGVDNLLPHKQGKKPSCCLPTKGTCVRFQKNDILIGNIRPYLQKIWHADSSGRASGDVLVIRCLDSSILPRYLFHVLSSDRFFMHANQYAKGSKMPRGSKNSIMRFLFSVPSLQKQHQTADLLDRLTQTTTQLRLQLEEEITFRIHQCEHYKNQLLSFPTL